MEKGKLRPASAAFGEADVVRQAQAAKNKHKVLNSTQKLLPEVIIFQEMYIIFLFFV